MLHLFNSAGGVLICDIFFRGVNIFLIKPDRGEGGSLKVKICVASFMNGPIADKATAVKSTDSSSILPLPLFFLI